MGARSNYSGSTGNKVIVLGDEMVGKTSIIKRRVSNTFCKISQETVEVDFGEVEQVIGKDSNIKIKLQLWDTAGQEVYRALNRLYFRDTIVTLLVFDLS